MPVLTGALPPSTHENWTALWGHLAIAVGVLYAKVGLTQDATLAAYLCIPRMTIGLLNVISLLRGKMDKAFWVYPIIEIATAVWIHKALA